MQVQTLCQAGRGDQMIREITSSNFALLNPSGLTAIAKKKSHPSVPRQRGARNPAYFLRFDTEVCGDDGELGFTALGADADAALALKAEELGRAASLLTGAVSRVTSTEPLK